MRARSFISNIFDVFLSSGLEAQVVTVIILGLLFFSIIVIMNAHLNLTFESRSFKKAARIFRGRDISQLDKKTIISEFRETLGDTYILKHLLNISEENYNNNENTSPETLMKTVNIDRLTPVSFHILSVSIQSMVILGLIGTFFGFMRMTGSFSSILAGFNPAAGVDIFNHVASMVTDLGRGLEGMGAAVMTSLAGLGSMLIASGYLGLFEGKFNKYLIGLDDFFRNDLLPSVYIPTDKKIFGRMVKDMEKMNNKLDGVLISYCKLYEQLSNSYTNLQGYVDKFDASSEKLKGTLDQVKTQLNENSRRDEEVKERIISMVKSSDKTQEKIAGLMESVGGMAERVSGLTETNKKNIEQMNQALALMEPGMESLLRDYRDFSVSLQKENIILNEKIMDEVKSLFIAVSRQEKIKKSDDIELIVGPGLKKLFEDYRVFTETISQEQKKLSDKIAKDIAEFFERELKKRDEEILRDKQRRERVISLNSRPENNRNISPPPVVEEDNNKNPIKKFFKRIVK